jgi:hypothetical protein
VGTSARQGCAVPLYALLSVLAACVVGIACCSAALAEDDDDGAVKTGSTKTGSTWPTTYLDLRTTYGTAPAGSLPIGFGNTALFTALQTLALSTGNTAPAIPRSLPLASRQSLGVDFPLTVDVSDGVSLYAGVSGTSTFVSSQGWSSFDITSWNVGLQADLYQQKGGRIPTITWQSTIYESVPNGPASTTTFNNILEFDYALDKDETRGLLVGVQDTRVQIGTPLARIHPNIIGYVGGYYQWPDNWKFTGRVGLDYFGGAELSSFTPIQPFTQPVVRLDIDRMDENDNRLFGITAQINWVPKPAYQLTLRTPLYFVRN